MSLSSRNSRNRRKARKSKGRILWTYQGRNASRSMIIIGRTANLSRARQGGRRFSTGISTQLHSRSTYSTVKTISEKASKASNSGRHLAYTESTVSAGEGQAVGNNEDDEEDVDGTTDGMGFAAHLQNVVNLDPSCDRPTRSSWSGVLGAGRACLRGDATRDSRRNGVERRCGAGAVRTSGLREIRASAPAFAAEHFRTGTGEIDSVV